MFDQAVVDEFRAHALAEFPKEACGLILKSETGCKFLACENIHNEPESFFEIDAAVFVEHEDEILAIVHSHTNGKDYPSEMDMREQQATDKTWGIVVTDGEWCSQPFYFGDGVPMEPLVGRNFRSGVTDCWAVVRDWWRTERNIPLPNPPRDHNWWKSADGKKNNLYLSKMKALGFHRISDEEVREGDICLMALASEKPNHAAVYIGGGLILHHVETGLSKRDPVAKYGPMIYLWARYEPEPTQDAQDNSSSREGG